MSSDLAAEIKDILAHYDLGELVDFERDERGFVNTSYAIETLRDGRKARYFLRLYKKGVREEELQFEHSLIEHLVARQFPWVARILRARSGDSYLRLKSAVPGEPEQFAAIFEFLLGEDRYTWVSPACSETETTVAAELLAAYHSAVSGFEPRGSRSEAKILELLPLIEQNLVSARERSKHSAFDEILAFSLGPVLRSLAQVKRSLEALNFSRMPQLVVHCDYHPGNLKFQEEGISGLFDFDWSKVDLRLFDLALAIWYFCTSWEGETDGQLRFDQATRFLCAYQAKMQDLPGVGPLNAEELATLPDMVAGANLYILNWAVEDYYQKEVSVEEYLRYLRHSLRFVEWFESPSALQGIAQMVAREVSKLPKNDGN